MTCNSPFQFKQFYDSVKWILKHICPIRKRNIRGANCIRCLRKRKPDSSLELCNFHIESQKSAGFALLSSSLLSLPRKKLNRLQTCIRHFTSPFKDLRIACSSASCCPSQLGELIATIITICSLPMQRKYGKDSKMVPSHHKKTRWSLGLGNEESAKSD